MPQVGRGDRTRLRHIDRDQGDWNGAGTPRRKSHGHCPALLSAAAKTALGQRELSPCGWVTQ